MESWHGTTILGVKLGGRTVLAGDGQVSMGNTVMKPNAKKVRRLGADGGIGGRIPFKPDGFKKPAKSAVVSVKSGGSKLGELRDLHGVTVVFHSSNPSWGSAGLLLL